MSKKLVKYASAVRRYCISPPTPHGRYVGGERAALESFDYRCI